jgi:hypothetical protein
MIRAIIWKEWHEHRSKYVAYWLVINAPILLLALAVGMSSAARTPFADLSDNTVLKYLPLALGEPLLLATVFLLATGYLAVATFRPEIEDGSLFFVYEQPVSRKRYVAMKLLIGGVHAVAAVCFATLFATAASYGMILLSGKVTLAGSASAFTAVPGGVGAGGGLVLTNFPGGFCRIRVGFGNSAPVVAGGGRFGGDHGVAYCRGTRLFRLHGGYRPRRADEHRSGLEFWKCAMGNGQPRVAPLRGRFLCSLARATAADCRADHGGFLLGHSPVL